jgi:hypothetical protein
VYNLLFVYQPPFYKGQQGLRGRLLGGWSFAPIFSVASGIPLEVNTATLAQSFGEADANSFFSGDGFGPGENAVPIGKAHISATRHDNVCGPNSSCATGTNGFGVNMFSNPDAVYNMFRDPILGYDTGHTGAAGTLRGLPFWNMDLSIRKTISVTERVGLEFQTVFTNVLNHVQLGDPFLEIQDSADWGVLGGSGATAQANRIRF